MVKVMIDAGHGGVDSGAVGNGLYEKNIVLSLAKRVQAILTNDYQGVSVSMTRTTDVFLELNERARLANNANVDLFFSIHVNAGGGTGYEDFIHSPLSDTSGTAKKRDKIHSAVVPVLNKYGIRNRGKKKANFAVLRETRMSAVLVETLFIDHKTDASLLKNATFLEDIAQAYAKGIASALGAARKQTVAPNPKPTDSKTNGKTHYVQIGAFGNKKNAEALAAKAKKAGFDVYIKTE